MKKWKIIETSIKESNSVFWSDKGRNVWAGTMKIDEREWLRILFESI